MEQIALVKGMKCVHCEAHVKEALEKIPGVLQIKADHVTSEVKIISEAQVSQDAIEKALSSTKYQFEGFKK